MDVVPYTDAFEMQWDQFCTESANGNFLATRRFLNYHGNRLKDASTLLMEKGKIQGVFPSAESPQNKRQVISHPGSTYGGIVHNGRLSGGRMIEAIEHIVAYYKRAGFDTLIYKCVPHIYARHPAQDDLYALFRLKAKRVRCDLSCTICLSDRRMPSKRRRRSLKKALKSNVLLSGDPNLIESLWHVIAENLNRKHDSRPVHSVDEMQMLMNLFPEQILLRGALVDGQLEAGVILFNSPTAWHAQYIASTEKGYSISALDAVFDACINEAENAGVRYFDFGTSNEKEGRVLNEGLYTFKSEFGGGGVAHEYYELVMN